MATKAIKPQKFRATLEAVGMGMNFVVARISVDLKKAWPEWTSRRVRGEINGFAFQTTLFPTSQGNGGLTLLVNKKMQAGARVRAGQKAEISLEPEMGEAKYELPPELQKELKQDKALWKYFQKLPPSMRKWSAAFVDQAKGPEVRQRRAQKTAENLMLAMEGELELPPILKSAFQRHPLAETGWNAMTPIQRRSHEIGIFSPQTVAGREKRIAWTMDKALEVARRKGGGEKSTGRDGDGSLDEFREFGSEKRRRRGFEDLFD